MINNPLTIILPGDYNGDSVVDAADFTVWRDILGAPSGTIPNNINGGPIREAQYDTWKSHFGDAFFGGSLLTTVVPEPPMALQVLASVGLCLVRDRAKYRNRKTGAICERSLDG